MKNLASTFFVLMLLIPTAAAEDIPSRPEKLNFPPLEYQPPEAGGFRVVLDNGIPAYLAEDRILPLISVGLNFRGGQYMEPAGKAGLASLTGTVWRTGGAGELTGPQLDEELDFLAANLSTGIGATTGSVSLNLLSKDIDRGLEILMDVLVRPRFGDERLDQARDDLLAAMKRRNDRTPSIEAREWQRLIYGDDFWMNRLPTKASVDSISRQDLVDFHELFLNPGDIVLSVSGDFDRQDMIKKLNATIGKLAPSNEQVPEVPQPTHAPEPGVYLIDKKDVNQGRVSMGHIGYKRPFEDEFDMDLANDILGGGGFTAWILSRVRSDEGLAYSAGSSWELNNTIPGTFRAFFQSKSSTCSRAADLILQLIDKLQTEGISQDELETSKNSFIQTFPNRFQSKFQTVNIFAQDELFGRPSEYWQEYRDRVSQVTTESARLAAQKYIDPGKFVILVVGNAEEILQGHPDFPEITFEKMGKITRLPLRDPMTLEPLSE
jgi:predicted Zn-dependent peptidase